MADSRSGIAPGHLPRIFNPSHTTKPRGCGTGQVLFIVEERVGQQGGPVRLQSTLGHAVGLEVVFPPVPPPAISLVTE